MTTRFVANIWAVLILAACTSGTPNTAPPPISPAPSITLTSTDQRLPTPTRTATPAPTTVPTPTVEVFEPLLITDSPWLVFRGREWGSDNPRLFILDPSTQQAFPITSEDTTLYWRYLVDEQVQGSTIVTISEDASNLWLSLVGLQSGTITPLASLLPPSGALDADSRDLISGALANTIQASWSDQRLAFIAGNAEGTTDIYLYDTSDIRRLTHESLWINGLFWSPQGDYLVYGLEEYFGENVCYGYRAMRAINLMSGEAQTLTPASAAAARVIGWQDDHTAMLISRFDDSCTWSALTAVDITTGLSGAWSSSAFTGAAFDPVSQTALLTRGGSQYYAERNLQGEQAAPASLVSSDDESTLDVAAYDSVYWSAVHGRFLLRSDTELIAISPQGDVTAYPAPAEFAPYSVSPDGRWIIWMPFGSYAITAWGQPITASTAASVHAWAWLPDSSGVYLWTADGIMYAQPPAFEPVDIAPLHYDGDLQWVQP